MKDIPSTINEGLIFDGMLFASPGDRCRYIGTTGNKHREQRWREQNPDKWMRLEDIPQSAAAEDVKGAEAPSSSAPSPDARGEPKDQDTDGSTEMPANTSPAEQVESTAASATAALAPSEIAKNAIAIDGHPHVSTARLASMLGISERTLLRRTANGNGPPHVYIAGNYYPIDKAREWAANRGLRLKTPSDNH
jgi:hypothetical protein